MRLNLNRRGGKDPDPPRLTPRGECRCGDVIGMHRSLSLDTCMDNPMKIITPSLCGIAYFAVVAASPEVGAAEFTCEAGQFNCLYDSVELANQTDEPDIIRFPEGIHNSVTSYPSRCAPPIDGDITIIGAGSDVTYLSAQGSCAYFHVEAGGSLTLRNIVIASGNLDGLKVGPGVAQRGAAVYNEGLLRIERSTLRGNGINDNFASLSGGGAIYNAPGAEAHLIDVEFLSNSVELQSYGGAAILNEGTMTVTRGRFYQNNGRGGIIVNGMPGSSAEASLILSDTIVENNLSSTGVRNGSQLYSKLLIERTTIRDGVAGEGAGIHNSGEMTVKESTIAFNTARKGGGIYSAEDSKSTFINSTISNNHAVNRGEGMGGGIFNYGGDVSISSSTISANTSDGLAAAITTTSDAQDSSRVYIKGSLIVGHLSSDEAPACHEFGPNDEIKYYSLGHNMVSEGSHCRLSLETDVMINESSTFTEVIGPLADNGGPTLTHALLPGSPAIDSSGSVCTDVDGLPIIIDQLGNPRTGCDIGSVDGNSEPLPVSIQLIFRGNQSGIRANTNGNINIAILSRAGSSSPFRPAVDVDRDTVQLGSGDAAAFKFTEQDINGDGIADLVMRFKIRETGITCGDTAIELRGAIIEATEFVASTAISTIGCNCN